MVAEVDIVNVALGRIGQKQLLSALTDNSTAARRSALVYPQVRDRLLQSYDWQWAETIQILALRSETVPGWGYAYSYPDDCLRLTAICDAAGARMWSRPTVWRETTQVIYPPNEPYRVFYSGDDDSYPYIATDVVEAYAVYVARVRNPNRFPPLFINALEWALAAELAAALEVEPKLATLALQMGPSSLSEAAAASANEGLDDPEPDSPSIRARG